MSILPNSTPIPHIIIREWMPLLKDTELRILLVVTDQTLGWIEDHETKRRKERDWISHYQLRTKIKKKGGKIGGDRSVSMAIAILCDKYEIIQALTEDGELLDTPEKRMKNGGKIFYRLNLQKPQATLFDTPAKSTGVVFPQPPQKVTPAKSTSYKRNRLYKRNNNLVNEKSSTPKKPKKPSKHTLFIDYWFKLVQKTRDMHPVVTKADAKNLQRILKMGIPTQTLEQITLFYLADPSFKSFSPDLKTIFSSGVINGLLNRTKNDPKFWKQLDVYIDRYMSKPSPEDENQPETRETEDKEQRVISIKQAISKLISELDKEE